jgi:hypothetical protein
MRWNKREEAVGDHKQIPLYGRFLYGSRYNHA